MYAGAGIGRGDGDGIYPAPPPTGGGVRKDLPELRPTPPPRSLAGGPRNEGPRDILIFGGGYAPIDDTRPGLCVTFFEESKVPIVGEVACLSTVGPMTLLGGIL